MYKLLIICLFFGQVINASSAGAGTSAGAGAGSRSVSASARTRSASADAKSRSASASSSEGQTIIDYFTSRAGIGPYLLTVVTARPDEGQADTFRFKKKHRLNAIDPRYPIELIHLLSLKKSNIPEFKIPELAALLDPVKSQEDATYLDKQIKKTIASGFMLTLITSSHGISLISFILSRRFKDRFPGKDKDACSITEINIIDQSSIPPRILSKHTQVDVVKYSSSVTDLCSDMVDLGKTEHESSTNAKNFIKTLQSYHGYKNSTITE